MKKDKILDNLRKQCDDLVMKCSSNTKRQVYMSILNILSLPNPFNYLDTVTAFNILSDLGYSKDEAVKMYTALSNWPFKVFFYL